MSRFAFILPGLVCLTLCPSARATLLAYDGFEGYTANAVLNANTGGTGWETDWSSMNTVKVVATASPITYTNGSLTINGGTRAAEAATPTTTPTDNVASRSFAEQTGTVYFSFLFRPESGAGGDDFIQFSLNNDTSITNSGSIGDLSTTSNVNNFAARVGGANGGTSVNGSTSLANATTFFLVGKMSKTSGGNYNRMDLFVNPSTLTEPGVTATASGDSGITALSYFTLRLAGAETTDQYRFDELRIGTTWADVTAVPEPATYAMIFGGLAMAAVVFCRRQNR